MTAIERTAYPRFKQHPSAKELAELYTPTPEEIKFVKSRVRTREGFLCFMVMLKSFQRLGYFSQPEDVPLAIIKYLRSYLKLHESVQAVPTKRQRRNYQQAILEYLEVKAYDKIAQKTIILVVSTAAQVKDHPADLINIAIEELVKERYQLPTFNTLDRLVCHVRAVTNNKLFARVSNSLSPTEQTYLDQLLLKEDSQSTATLNLLKSPPKSAKLKHIKELLSKFNQLMTFGDAKRLLSGITPAKIKHLASQAIALDISEFQDLKLSKRRTILLCLLYQAQVKTRDHLVEMYLKMPIIALVYLRFGGRGRRRRLMGRSLRFTRIIYTVNTIFVMAVMVVSLIIMCLINILLCLPILLLAVSGKLCIFWMGC